MSQGLGMLEDRLPWKAGALSMLIVGAAGLIQTPLLSVGQACGCSANGQSLLFLV